MLQTLSSKINKVYFKGKPFTKLVNNGIPYFDTMNLVIKKSFGILPIKLVNNIGDNSVAWSITGNTIQQDNLINIANFSGSVSDYYYDETNAHFKLEPGKTYTVAYTATTTGGAFIGSVLRGTSEAPTNDIGKVENQQSGSRVIITFTVPTDIGTSDNLWFRFVRYSSQKTYNYSVSNIVLREGQIPPQQLLTPAIVSGVGDKTENLFPTNTRRYEYAIDGVLQVIDYPGGCMYFINVKTNTDYVITLNSLGESTFIKSATTNNPRIGTIVENFEDGYEKHGLTVNPFRSFNSGNNQWLVFYVSAAFAVNHDNVNKLIMLNEGTEPLPYKPFGYEIPVVSKGKEYLPGELEIGTLSASEGLPVIMYTRLRTKDFTVLNPGTYTVEVTAFTGEDLYGLAFEYDVNTKAFIRRMPEAWTKMPFTFTIDTQRKIKFIIAKTNGGSDKIYPNEIKFAGITEYTATPIYLGSQLMFDEVLKSDGSREVKLREVALTGNETSPQGYVWEERGTGLFGISDIFKDNAYIVGAGYSNFLKYNPVQSGIVANLKDGEFALQLYIHDDGEKYYNLFIKNLNCNNLTDFKNWLNSMYNAGNPVTLYYPLATPTTETVDVPQIQIIKGDSTIDVSTTVKPVKMEVDYLSLEDLTT